MKSLIFVFSLIFICISLQANSINPVIEDSMSKKIYVGNLPHHYEPEDVEKLVYEVTGHQCKSKKLKPGSFLIKFKPNIGKSTLKSILDQLDGYRVEDRQITIHHDEIP